MRYIKYSIINNSILIILITLLSSVTFAQKKSADDPVAGFRASVVKVDVTPQTPQWLRGYDPRLSTGVHDHIFLRIVALDDGKTQFLLISHDIVSISPAEYDRVASILESKYGINPLNVWWGTTHDHSAPGIGQFKGISFPSMANRSKLGDKLGAQIDPNYSTMVEQKLIDGILEARKKLVPARLGVGWGFSQANINRRGIDENGKASLGLNPDLPVDRRIGLIRIDKEDGNPLVLIANYPMHGTVFSGKNTEISGDAPGIVSEYVEQKIGVPMLFMNGAAGNIAPIYSVYDYPQAQHYLSQFKVLLGDKILEANRKISTAAGAVRLVVGSLVVETPRRPDVGWSPDLNDYTRTTKTGVNMVRLPIRFLKINDDIAIWSAPLELFCEVSNEVRSRSPFPYTFYYGYTNGSLGYLPTASAWEHGGYEPEVSPFTPSAAKDLTESVIGYLQGEMRNKSMEGSEEREFLLKQRD